MPPRGVLGEAWHLYRAHWLEVVRMAAAVYGGVAVISAFAIPVAGQLGLVFLAYLWLAAVLWVQAPLARLVDDVRAGRERAGVRRTLESVYPRVGTISVATLLAALGVYVGLGLFVLPGLFLLTRWSLLVPVITLEGAGTFTAFARSRDLGRGHRWSVFGGIVASGIALVLVWAAVAGLSFVAAVELPLGAGLIAAAAITVVVLSVATPPLAIAWTLKYYELREERPLEAAPEPGRLAVGGALDQAWALYKKHPGRLLALGAVVAPLVTVVQVTTARGLATLAVAATLVGYLWLEGLLAEGLPTFDEPSGRRWVLGVLRSAAPRLPALVGAGLVAGVAFATGIGLLLLVPWSVVGAAVVVERRGVAASLGRSSELVAGRRRRVLKLLVLSVLMAAAGSLLLLFLVPPVGGRLLAYGLAIVLNAVTAPYVALAWALMYRELQRLRDELEPVPPATAPALR